MLGSLLPGAQHLQNIHPLVVHFPIAFLMGAALLYGLAWIFRRETWSAAAFVLLVLGTLSAVVAVGSGLYAEPGVMVSYSVREQLLLLHKRYVLATLGLSIVLVLWAVSARPFPRQGRFLFLLLFLVLVVIMTKGADYGGRMVYDYNAGGNACPQPIEFTK